ncbi:MAG: tRNA lysidine(34) synthetase TilS, partial [Clostridiales Family XIII bacterium]|nr:tRNA lysidine(34) synthetase TilS [Clostridiales Family XIII bacterium]
QAETVLMRILRGTGPDGLAAMPHLREDEGGFAVIRPLLDVPRARIEAYCAAEGLTPARDRSNKETAYTRNRIRLSLLPLLEKDYNENIVEALARLAANAAEDRAYFDEITGDLLARGRFAADGGFELPLALFAEARAALRHRLIVRGFERVGLTQDIAAVHLRAADALIEGGRTGKAVDFPNGYRLSLRYGHLRFSAAGGMPSGAGPHERSFPLDALLRVPVFSLEAGAGAVRLSLHPAPRADGSPAGDEMPAADGTPAEIRIELDFDLLAAAHGDIGVRSRRAGDWMRPAGMDGTKLIQDLFVDAKLPREDRETLPLIAAGDEILCVLAAGRLGRRTGNYAVTAATRRILRIACASP